MNIVEQVNLLGLEQTMSSNHLKFLKAEFLKGAERIKEMVKCKNQVPKSPKHVLNS